MNAPETARPAVRLPLWLLLVDFVGMLLLGGGLAAQFAPDTALAAILLPFKLPLLVVGGVLMGLGMLLAMRVVLQQRPPTR